MAEENKQDNQSSSDRDREQRRAQEQAQREERRAKEQAQREERKAKEDAARKVTPTKGALEKQAAREAAKEYGIDTKGMSTREIKAAVSEAETAQKQLEDDMSKFIEKSLNNFIAKKGGDVAPMDNPASVTNRLTETQPLPFSSSGGPTKQKSYSSIKFYCYYDGEAGYLDLFGDPTFKTDL
jgi:hypothetical protein